MGEDWGRKYRLQKGGWQQEQGQGWFHQQHNQQEWPTRRPPMSGGRPPKSPGPWRHTSVPLWEKKFCTKVCSIPWGKIVQTQKLMYLYQTVVHWDDSAGEEAFNNAKARYWAEINGFDFDIPLPDPDKYIDVVDQKTFLDPQLVEDLYAPPLPPASNDEENVLIWDSFIFPDRQVPVIGWGDDEDQVPINSATNNGVAIDPQTQTLHQNIHSNRNLLLSDIQATGWGDNDDQEPTNIATNNGLVIDPQSETCGQNVHSSENYLSWGKPVQATGWGDATGPGPMNDATNDGAANSWNAHNSVGKEMNDTNSNDWSQNGGWGNKNVQDNSWASGKDYSRGHERENSGMNWERRKTKSDRSFGTKRDGGGRFDSQYMNSDYHGANYQQNKNWRNCKGKHKTNLTSEQSANNKRPSPMQQWNHMHSCGPADIQESDKSTDRLQWQKSVS